MPKAGSAPAASAQAQSTGDSIVAKINAVSDIVGTLVPTVGAIGSMVRLVATAVRPTDAQQAQLFDDAIADFDKSVEGLNAVVADFDKAKAAALAAKQ